MLKTSKQVERDFYQMLKQSELLAQMDGELYRAGKRPSDSKKEDVVVKFIAGTSEQTQVGVVIVNCYVPDVSSKKAGRMIENDSRTALIEELVTDFVVNNKSVEYLMELDGTPTTLENAEIGQHFVSARIKFSRITE